MNPSASAVAEPRVDGSTRDPVPELVGGDRLRRVEFRRRYEAMPGLKKAELIEGVVYLPSPVRLALHGRPHGRLMGWLGTYEAETPGVECADNATLRLDNDNEPQPDALLRILPEHGGLSSTDDDYLMGPVELVAEVSGSTASYDLHDKLNAYRRSGVLEYVVWRVQDGAIDWFVLTEGRYDRLTADEAGVLKSPTFPGLWLDAPALLRGDLAAVLRTLRSGCGGEEHASFASRLSDRRSRP